MSTRSERFFMWIWRLNGLSIFLLLACALYIAGFRLLDIYRAYNHAPTPVQKVTQIAGTDFKAKNFHLSNFQNIERSKFIYANLMDGPLQFTTQGFAQIYSNNATSGHIRNVLFFDTSSKSARWLLSNNDKMISSFQFVKYPNPNQIQDPKNEEPKISSVLFVIENMPAPETDANTQPPPKKTRELFVASPDGTNPTLLTTTFDGLLGQHQTSETEILVFYIWKNEAKVIDYDLSTHKVISDTPLAVQ